MNGFSFYVCLDCFLNMNDNIKSIIILIILYLQFLDVNVKRSSLSTVF